MASERQRLVHLGYRLLVEMGPLLLFFVVTRAADILAGTAALMIAGTVAAGHSWWRERRVPLLPLIGAGFTVFFGGLTLAFQEPVFIKARPTIYNAVAAVVLAAALLRGRLILRSLFDTGFGLPESAWRALTWRAVGFLLVLAVLNEAVWRGASTDTWVAFKAFVMPPLNLLFVGGNWLVIRRQVGRPDDRPPPCGEARPATPGR